MTKIEWTEATWNPIVGCSLASPGCTNCYAMLMAARIEKMNPDLEHYRGLTKPSKAGPVWTGKVSEAPREKLLDPLRRRKPTMWFVGSMTDLCQNDIPDEWRDVVLAVIAMTPHHTYQWLTKRSANMRRYFSAPDLPHRIQRAMDVISVDMEQSRLGPEQWRPVVGYESLYEVSSAGRIRRILKTMAPQELSQIKHCRGYLTVSLSSNGVARHHLVHRIVLEAFIGPADEDQESLHRNGNKTDNRLANLRWGTRADNMEDAARHGTAGTWMKRNATLSSAQATEIRQRRARGEKLDQISAAVGSNRKQVCAIALGHRYKEAKVAWPLPNLWLGVSAEDQRRAEERIPDLLATGAAVRFVSCEPLIGPVNLRSLSINTNIDLDTMTGSHSGIVETTFDELLKRGIPTTLTLPKRLPALDWIIVGGESGPRARPMALGWAKDIVRQCTSASVPVFVKQLGAYPTNREGERCPNINHPKGANPNEWPEELRVRQFPNITAEKAA